MRWFWRRRNLRNRLGFACTLFLNSDLISLFDQLGRGRAHALGKSNAFFDPDGSLVVLAEIIGKDFGAKRYATLFHRYDPAVADIPDEHVAAMFMSLDVYVGRVKRLARQSDVVRQSFAQRRRQPGRKSNPDGSRWRRTVRNRRCLSGAGKYRHS